MTQSKAIPNLKGEAIKHKGSLLTVMEQYVVDGQIVLVTEKEKIRIDKSEAADKLVKMKQHNGSKPKNEEDRVAGAFYVTENLDQFVFHEKNRDINQAHVKNLISSIAKNDLLHAQPILVNEKMEVIDGQHRLSAAREIGRKIYYIIRDGLTIEDAISLNINTKNWGYGDYMEYWIAQENPAYIYYKKFKERYRLSYTIAISMLHSGTSATQWGTKKVFENGDLEINYRKKSEFIGRLSLLFSRYGSFTNDRSFIRALDMSISTGRLDPWLFLKKLELCPDKFYKCSDTDSYLRMMEEVINYHSRGERIRIF